MVLRTNVARSQPTPPESLACELADVSVLWIGVRPSRLPFAFRDDDGLNFSMQIIDRAG
jgi:hypothetical protein